MMNGYNPEIRVDCMILLAQMVLKCLKGVINYCKCLLLFFCFYVISCAGAIDWSSTINAGFIRAYVIAYVIDYSSTEY